MNGMHRVVCFLGQKKYCLFFIIALLMPLLGALLLVKKAPTEIRLLYSGNPNSNFCVYYQREKDQSYSEKCIVPGQNQKHEFRFVLPADAVFERTRFDFGDKHMILEIKKIIVSQKFFRKTEISPSAIQKYYIPNQYVSWTLVKNGRLRIETFPNDPFAVPRGPEIAGLMRDSASLDGNHLAVFTRYALLWYLFVVLVFWWNPLSQWYQKRVKPIQWYLAFPVFIGCFYIVYPIRNGMSWANDRIIVALFCLFFVLCRLGEVLQNKLASQKDAARVPAKKKLKMDMTMVYFRAFAILAIIGGHYLNVSLWYPTKFPSWMRSFVVACFSEDSIYFLFISGYLFYYLTDHFTVSWNGLRYTKEAGRFNLPVFYRKKITNVLLPYIIISVLATLYMIATNSTSGFVGASITLAQLPSRLLYGTVQMQFWYIPYIAIVFLLAPLLLVLPHRVFCALLIPAFACLIAVKRPANMVSFEGFLSLAPAFLFGMYYALDRERLFRFFKSSFWYFLAASLICSVFLCRYGYMKSLTSLHKLCMIPVVIVLFSYIENRKLNGLILIANLSFALYFLHMLFVQRMAMAITHDMQIFGISSFIVICLARTVLTFVFLLIFCWSLKILTGKYSRIFIGA